MVAVAAARRSKRGGLVFFRGDRILLRRPAVPECAVAYFFWSVMPIYEFECQACEAVFDRLQKLSDPDPTECPECGQPRVKRRLTAPAFRLAGTGWYETDFKKDGDKKRNLAEKTDSTPAKTDAGSASSGSASGDASTSSSGN